MKRIIKVGIISLIALSSAALTGCDPKPVQTSSSPTSSVSSTTSTSSTLSSDSSIQDSSSSEKQVIHVSSITFATQSKKMVIGEAILLSVNVLPADADNKDVTYSIDNTDSFSITTAGLLTANKEGEVTVTATSVDSEKTATLSFTAVKPLEKIEGTSYFFEPKEGTKDLAQYPGAKNGDAVGYVNYNGYKQTIAVNATEEGKVSVYFNLAHLDGTNPLASLKVNGTEASDYAPLFDVSDSWDTFCRVHVANIDLVEGKNTIEIDVSKVVSKYDYMELVSPFVITETEKDKGIEPITGTSFDFEPKAGTKDLGAVEGAKNGDAVCFVNYNGYSETFKITSTADGKASLFVAASHCDGNNPVSSLTVNGTKVTVFASEFIQSDDWDKMDKIFVSNIDLIKGNNVIEMSIGTNVAKYDYMELVSEGNLEKTIEEEPLTPIEGTSYDFEPKAGTKDLGALEGAKNGDAVSYVNYNGYAETFNITATDDSKASLFIAASHCDGNNPVTSLKVNDTAVTSFALEFISSDDWDRMDKIFITNIDLVKGTNVIEMSIGKNVAKYDYMELVTTSTIDSVMTPVTGTSFDFEPKEGTKDLGALDGAKNGDAVNYVNYNGYSETFNITSSKATIASMYVVVAHCDGNNPVTSLKVNDIQITKFATSFTSSDDWDKMDKIFVSNIDLIEGNNVIEMSIGKNVAKYDYMELVSDATLEKTPENQPLAPIEGTSYVYEPAIGTKDLGALDGAKNGDAVNYVNYNGYSEVFNITSDSAKKASLYVAVSHCDGNNPVTSLKVNDVVITKFAASFTNSDDWNRIDRIYVTNIDLVEGTNSISMSIGTNVAKYDYMELITTASLTA